MINPTIQKLYAELAPKVEKSFAIALDFDGVCKLFTEYKHQIMSTALFIHLREFQRVPFEVFRDAYVYINFRSADYAGKERFLCSNALSEYLAGKGYNCALPGLHKAVKTLLKAGEKISAANLKQFASDNDVKRALAWSAEINERVALLTEIGLTPGILENILEPFRTKADFYIVSTATEEPIRASMEKENINFIRRYIGQETATKTEALTALGLCGYENVSMFGDSVEDERASVAASKTYPPGQNLIFIPVIPGDEKYCFVEGRKALEALLDNRLADAKKISEHLTQAFQGREAGSKAQAPLSIQA
ncbi:MAG: hypothetical protein GX811_06695 [Lentisphaerae bacterium]|nr:hypothetical protein [Lentisphaerota bacterium]